MIIAKDTVFHHLIAE